MAKNDGLEEIGLAILDKVELSFFTVSPQTIVPFEEAELSWKATGPDDKPFSIVLNGVKVSKTGSAEVHPISTTTYQIKAVAASASKLLGKITLAVNREDCHADIISGATIEGFVKTELPRFIKPGSTVRLRDDPVSVKLDAGRMVMSIFLQAGVPGFFSADIELVLTFSPGVTITGEVRTPLENVDADVKFDFPDSITGNPFNPLTAGVSAFTAAVAEAIVALMTETLIGTQLEEALAEGIQTFIEIDCTGRLDSDSRIISIRAAGNSIEYECCPLTEKTRFSDILQSGRVLTQGDSL